jgi:hypothetical protein
MFENSKGSLLSKPHKQIRAPSRKIERGAISILIEEHYKSMGSLGTSIIPLLVIRDS